jgi:hypothetical protein
MAELANWQVRDRRELELLGKMLDSAHATLHGRSVGVFLAESLLKVRGRDGVLRPLKANAAQRAYERRRGAGNIVLKARQMGMTTWVAGRMLLKTITQPGTLTLQVAHTQESAEEILRIVHRFVEHLPEGLNAGVLKTARNNVRQIVFPEIDSEFRVESAADRNAGRGLTAQNLHCSEVSRWPGNAAETLAGLRAGLAPGGEQVLESTPNGIGGCFYEEWQAAGETGLVQHFFPWWLERDYRRAPVKEGSLTEKERELIGDYQLDLEQIGYRRGMLANLRGLARQEMVEDAESCFRISGEPYFAMEAVEARLATIPPPQSCRDNGTLEVWLPPIAGRAYVIAVDPAGGGAEGDFSAMEVIDLETGMQCAEFAAHVTGSELAGRAASLGKEYNGASIVVERNNHGSGILWLLTGSLHYEKVFMANDGQQGWPTTALTRPAILARLSAVLEENPEALMSRKLLVECRSFVRLANGNTGARSGAHDDRVMAMAIGLAARADLLARGLLHRRR